ncbi:DUF6573 family protein [Microtetraspora fusca]|uniref:DUF6573 family protein n=1 Tax=Microtetraspora fusca TaxID=1997 RepID=A0ABW6VEH6_MICFU
MTKSTNEILEQIDGVISGTGDMMRWAPPGTVIPEDDGEFWTTDGNDIGGGQTHTLTAEEHAAELVALYGEPIHVFTRAQMIEDGALVEVPENIAREAGFRHPMAMTASVWSDSVRWTDDDDTCQRTYQDESGRLWDVLWMARKAALTAGNTDRSRFTVARIPRDGRSRTAKQVTLEMVIGPGDNFEPVITIQFPGED